MSAAPRRARLSALAKINLYLKVLHRRSDGFHELRTVFQTVSLADRIELEFTPGRRRAIAVASDVEIPGENLVERAARLVLESARVSGEVRIGLAKRIPMGAGLGGGSSDAAAILLALPVLAGRNLPLETLIGLGAQLGSDVPFFLLGGTAAAVGRGTELYPLAGPPARYGVLAVPGVRVSTAEAYGALGRELTSAAPENIISSFESFAWSLASAPARTPPKAANDFESVVFRQYPQLERIQRRLFRLGARPALLSGSGSALYGLFETREGARKARQSLGGEVQVIRLVSRVHYRAMWRRQLAGHISGKVWPPQSRYA